MRTYLLLLLLGTVALAGCTTDGPSPIGPETDGPLAGLPAHWARLDSPPEFEGGDWFNTPDNAPISVDDLDGQVFMVDFWTYSCVNCIRTFPHLDGLYATYKDLGFTIIGVHSPEFEFEKDPDNVQDGIDTYGIDYPVVMDNDFAIWRAYQGTGGGYWPAHFLFDADGEIRGYHRGEGAYAETEDLVRQLLMEAGHTDLPEPFEGSDDSGPRHSGRTPELYAGYQRQSEALGNPEGYSPGDAVEYQADGAATRHQIYLDGTWDNGAEAMTAVTDGSVYLDFTAGAANFVADGPEGVCVPVLLDGDPIPMDLAGRDVQDDPDGPCIPLDSTPRSYDFYAGPFEDHLVQFRVPDGFALYTFAFSNEAME